VESSQYSPHEFEPVQVLGTGSFAQVYLVRSKKNQEPLALKIMNKESILKREKEHFIENELQILALVERLESKFLCRSEFAFESDSKYFIAMPFL